MFAQNGTCHANELPDIVRKELRFKWYSLCIPLVHSVSSWPTALWRFLPYGYAIRILQVTVALNEE